MTRAAFGDLGSAGGHRTMAKAVIPLGNLLAEALPEETSSADRAARRVSRIKATDESATARACQERIVRRFLRVLAQNGKS